MKSRVINRENQVAYRKGLAKVKTRIFFLRYRLLFMLQGRNKKDKDSRENGGKNFNGKRRKESKDRRRNYMLKRVVISSEAVRETCKIVFRAGRTPRDHSFYFSFLQTFSFTLRSPAVKKNPHVILRGEKEKSKGCIVFLILNPQT